MKKQLIIKEMGGLSLKGYLLLAALIFSAMLFAQNPAGNGNPPNGAPTGNPPTSPPGNVAGQPCWNSECIPIDGGVVFLIVAGVLLGVRLLYVFKRQEA